MSCPSSLHKEMTESRKCHIYTELLWHDLHKQVLIRIWSLLCGAQLVLQFKSMIDGTQNNFFFVTYFYFYHQKAKMLTFWWVFELDYIKYYTYWFVYSPAFTFGHEGLCQKEQDTGHKWLNWAYHDTLFIKHLGTQQQGQPKNCTI